MKLGFIGAGRMATALAKGCVQAGLVPAQDVLASDPVEAARTQFAQDVSGARIAGDNAAVLAGAETVVLAVKPQDMRTALRELAPGIRPETLVVSMAAGITLALLEEELPEGTHCIRVMTNTPVFVDEAMSAISPGTHATEEHLEKRMSSR